MRGRLGTATAEYPLHRRRDDPDYATQSHDDQMDALVKAMRAALEQTAVRGGDVVALALDTTGSSVVPVDAGMQPLSEYYLWCDHRAKKEAQQITALAHAEKLEAIEWCGGVYSHEWGFAKLLHFLRHNPDKRAAFASAFEHCDMVAATLCGITDPKQVKRSACAMGHKWMWNPKWDGLPSQAFLSKVDPLFDGVREKLAGEYLTSDHIAGHLSAEWADALGLRAGIPIPVGAFDAHWDAIGAGCREGDVVNVVGTSTCIIAMEKRTTLVPGVCGVVPGSVHPAYTGVEAGLSATGDIFEAIARRAGTKVQELSQGLERYRAGQTGLLRLSWDNGDRTVLVNAELGGVTLGLESRPYRAGRVIRRHRRHRIPHAHHSRTHGGKWSAGGADHQWWRNPAAECGAESGLRERAEQARAGAGWHPDQPRLLHLRAAGGGCGQLRRAGAIHAVPAASHLFCRSHRPSPSMSASSRTIATSISPSALRMRRPQRLAPFCRS